MNRFRVAIRILTFAGLIVLLCAEVRMRRLQKQIDATHQEMSEYQAKKPSWLPEALPNHLTPLRVIWPAPSTSWTDPPE